MKIQYRNGLIFTSIIIEYNGKIVEVDNIVVDTGASACIIEPSVIEDLGINFTKDDEIETFYGVNGVFNYVKRKMNISIDDITLKNINFYLGTIDENINGLLGLDVLMRTNAVIDLKNMIIKISL